MGVSGDGKGGARQGREAQPEPRRTNLADNLVVFQDAPAYAETPRSVRRTLGENGSLVSLTDVNTVVVPVCAGHVLVDVCVDTSHACGSGAVDARSRGRRLGRSRNR